MEKAAPKVLNCGKCHSPITQFPSEVEKNWNNQFPINDSTNATLISGKSMANAQSIRFGANLLDNNFNSVLNSLHELFSTIITKFRSSRDPRQPRRVISRALQLPQEKNPREKRDGLLFCSEKLANFRVRLRSAGKRTRRVWPSRITL